MRVRDHVFGIWYNVAVKMLKIDTSGIRIVNNDIFIEDTGQTYRFTVEPWKLKTEKNCTVQQQSPEAMKAYNNI